MPRLRHEPFEPTALNIAPRLGVIRGHPLARETTRLLRLLD
jgi:hypothetical protein